MQDKNANIDKKFTDHAWVEMESLLDQELPVSEFRRKQPLVLWKSLALGLAALLVGVYLFINFYNLDLRDKDEITLASNKNESQNLNTIVNTNTENINKTSVTSSRKQRHYNANQNQGNPENPVALSNISKNDNDGSNKNKISHKIEEPKLFKSNHELLNGNQSAKLNEVNGSKDTSTINGYIMSNENNSLSTRNPIIKIEEKEIEKLVCTPIIDPLPISGKKQKRISQSIFASSLFLPQSKTNGLNIGYMRNIKTNKQNLEIQTGIAYKYLAQPIEYTFTEISSITNGQTGTPLQLDILYDISYSGSNSSKFLDSSGSFENYDPSRSNDIGINKLNLHYLSIPIQLNLRKGRINLCAGIQGSILLLASNNSFGGGVLRITSSNYNEDLLSVNPPATISDLPNPKLSLFDLSATIGTGFDLSKNIALNLNYIHGIKDVIKHNSKKDFNRLLQISLKYSW